MFELWLKVAAPTLVVILAYLLYRVVRIVTVEARYVEALTKRDRNFSYLLLFGFVNAWLLAAALLYRDLGGLSFLSQEWFCVLLLVPEVVGLWVLAFLAVIWWGEVITGERAKFVHKRSSSAMRIGSRVWAAIVGTACAIVFGRALFFTVEIIATLEIIGVAAFVLVGCLYFLARPEKRGVSYVRHPCRAGKKIVRVTWRRARSRT